MNTRNEKTSLVLVPLIGKPKKTKDKSGNNETLKNEKPRASFSYLRRTKYAHSIRSLLAEVITARFALCYPA